MYIYKLPITSRLLALREVPLMPSSRDELQFVYDWSQHEGRALAQKLEQERGFKGVTRHDWEHRVVIMTKHGSQLPLQWNGGDLTTDFTDLQDSFPVEVKLMQGEQEEDGPKRLYKAPTDFTKLQKTIQSPRTLYKDITY